MTSKKCHAMLGSSVVDIDQAKRYITSDKAKNKGIYSYRIMETGSGYGKRRYMPERARRDGGHDW